MEGIVQRCEDLDHGRAALCERLGRARQPSVGFRQRAANRFLAHEEDADPVLVVVQRVLDAAGVPARHPGYEFDPRFDERPGDTLRPVHRSFGFVIVLLCVVRAPRRRRWG